MLLSTLIWNLPLFKFHPSAYLQLSAAPVFPCGRISVQITLPPGVYPVYYDKDTVLVFIILCCVTSQNPLKYNSQKWHTSPSEYWLVRIHRKITVLHLNVIFLEVWYKSMLPFLEPISPYQLILSVREFYLISPMNFSQASFIRNAWYEWYISF